MGGKGYVTRGLREPLPASRQTGVPHHPVKPPKIGSAGAPTPDRAVLFSGRQINGYRGPLIYASVESSLPHSILI